MKPTDLRGILQYVPQFRDRVFVIAMDGAVVIDENFANLLLDIAVLRSLNIRVVLVHGASAVIQAEAERRNITPSNLDGTGVTDEVTLDLAINTANRLTHEILEGLSANNLRSACQNAISASPVGIIKGVDYQFTGKVERVDVELLNTLLTTGTVPVIPPLGFDSDGRTYRINSDAMAVAVAKAFGAIKLIFITTHDGITVNGEMMHQMIATELETILKGKPDIPPALLSKATHAVKACQQGIPRVHVINGLVDEGLLAEVFSNEGIGTLIYANEYRAIRPAKKSDIRTLRRMTRHAVLNDELLKRSRSDMEKDFGDYYIYEIDHNPVGCIALHSYADQGKGELAFLFVAPFHENLGIGKKLIQFVESRARELGLKELFALSTQAFSYLKNKAGFDEENEDTLPAVRREKYTQSKRRSRILVKTLKG